MATTKLLTDKIKGLPTVNTPAATSTLVTDADGNLKRLNDTTGTKFSNIPGSFDSGWVRVAQWNIDASILIDVHSSWGVALPSRLLLAASGHILGAFNLSAIVKHGGGYTKARLVRSGNDLYLDLYLSNKPANIRVMKITGNAQLTDITFNPSVEGMEVKFEQNL